MFDSTRRQVRKKLPGYGAFSGGDMLVSIVFPGSSPYAVGECSTLTYSTNREIGEVRTLGRISLKGYTRGQRIVAGTIVFTVFEQHLVNNLKERIRYLHGIKGLLTDELPPFDIIITFGNEYGRQARLIIYGVVAYEDGKIFSAEDLFTENVWSYIARDIVLMDSDEGFTAQTPEASIKFNDEAYEAIGKFKVGDLLPEQMSAAAQLEYQRYLDELAKQVAIRKIIDEQVSNPPAPPTLPYTPEPKQSPLDEYYTLIPELPNRATFAANFNACDFNFRAGFYRAGGPEPGKTAKWTATVDTSNVLDKQAAIVKEAVTKVMSFQHTTTALGTYWQMSANDVTWIRRLPLKAILCVKCEITGVSVNPILWAIKNDATGLVQWPF